MKFAGIVGSCWIAGIGASRTRRAIGDDPASDTLGNLGERRPRWTANFCSSA